MSNILPLLGPRLVAPLTPQASFAYTRGAMLRAYVEWLRDNPGPCAVQDEIDATVSAMQQLQHLGAAYG